MLISDHISISNICHNYKFSSLFGLIFLFSDWFPSCYSDQQLTSTFCIWPILPKNEKNLNNQYKSAHHRIWNKNVCDSHQNIRWRYFYATKEIILQTELSRFNRLRISLSLRCCCRSLSWIHFKAATRRHIKSNIKIFFFCHSNLFSISSRINEKMLSGEVTNILTIYDTTKEMHISLIQNSTSPLSGIHGP